MSDKEFNPAEHMLPLTRNKKQGNVWVEVVTEYLEVKWRLVWLRDRYPDATIETRLHSHDEAEAIFTATVTIPTGGSATGWGAETKTDFGDYLEKAETKAVGRALAALGFGSQFCDDYAEDGSVADAPVARTRKAPAKRAATYDGAREATQATEQPGKARSDLRKVLTVKFGVDEKAAFDYMEKVEPGCISGTTIDFSVITPERCKEIISITEPQA
jgi:hypothetical protein